jgi:ATP-dependent Clp protease adaptor protein ClpS
MSNSDILEDIKIDEKIKKVTREPGKYKVIMLNDDQTPMEWVIEILMTIFKHSETTAKELTLTIHNEGSGVAGIYSYEIAEQKAIEATTSSRDRGFPLQLRVDKE